MGFFKKKKTKEPEELEEELEDVLPKKKLPKSKEFKDLKSENKRARKELKKPWGIKERGIIFGLLLLTASVSSVLSLSSRGWKVPKLPRLNLSSLPFLGEEKYIIEGDSPGQAGHETLQKIREVTNNYSGIYGVYVVDLTDGNDYGLYETEEFEAASLIKLPLMATVYREVEKGTLSLNEIYRLEAQDKRGGAGSISTRPNGTKFTYRELLELMGKESDNTAYAALKRIVGEKVIDETLSRIGMYETSLSDNATTPNDIGQFFRILYKGEILTLEHRDELLGFLTDTNFENWLPKGIPDSITIAHKFGREVRVVNDAGIVFSSKPYAVVVMSKGIVEKEADEVLPKLSEIVFEAQSKSTN